MILLSAVFGLVIGSFLNVLIYRLNAEKAPQWWQGRSVCPQCKKPIAWFDNIPLLSFVALGGRCRRCRTRISWQYPLVELVTAISFGLIGPSPLLLILAAVFIVIFFSDWIYGLIPDEMIIVGSVATIFLGPNLLVGIFSALGLFSIVLATKFRGMGLGDVKLAFLMGLNLGWPKILVAFWAAFVLGGLAALMLLLLKKVRLSDRMAFGPYLVLGTIFSALWTGEILATLLLR